MKTWTAHKLNDIQLQKLSAICHGRQPGGVTVFALQARGLIEGPEVHKRPFWRATDAGREALLRARVEGW